MGPFEMEQVGAYPSKYFTLTILKMSKEEKEGGKREERILYHLWYHSWPDFGVPDDTTPFLDFVECVRAFKKSVPNVPVLVHCSAGIGRTGTFVAVNLGIEELEDTGRVDPLGYICQLRQDRGGMIQTLDQYVFVYRALHAYLQRTADRDREEKDLPRISNGFYTLRPDNPLLPSTLELPVVTDEEGCRVGDDFLTTITQAQRFVSRYSISSVDSYKHSTTGSIGPPPDDGCGVNGKINSSSSSPQTSQKPLLTSSSSPPNSDHDVTNNTTLSSSSPPQKKQKRKSKVKSLFFPGNKDNNKLKKSQTVSHSSYNVSMEMEPQHKRSLSLSNVKLSRDNVLTASITSSVGNRPNQEILVPDWSLADNQSRDLNIKSRLVVCLFRSVPGVLLYCCSIKV
eukprot:sb/3465440/